LTPAPSAIGASAEDKKDETPKPQNELISDFVDNPAKYKGKTLTLQVTYVTKLIPLNKQDGEKAVPFTALDPNNKAKLILGLDIPKGLKLPAAMNDEEVIVTFKCEAGSASKSNVAVSIVRPAKVKP
jgi:hypothetical protein